MLVNRVSNLDLTWRQEIDDLANRPSPTLELSLDDLGLRRSIEQLTFREMKRNYETPVQCTSSNLVRNNDEPRMELRL